MTGPCGNPWCAGRCPEGTAPADCTNVARARVTIVRGSDTRGVRWRRLAEAVDESVEGADARMRCIGCHSLDVDVVATLSREVVLVDVDGEHALALCNVCAFDAYKAST